MEKVNYKFEQLRSASARLDEALLMPDSAIKVDAVIQRFEFTTELFWKFLKELLESNKVEAGHFPLDVIRAAKERAILAADEKWADLIRDRNLTSHTYNEEKAQEIYSNIKDKHAAMFREFINDYNRTRA
ncbi:nucleotidyltransferase substrate binding protein [Candidatus Saccharibacteria bacterium]|nr:nucleotidyltransferase substrate binding protein [Candidatus Saccharibacteria bacterium]